jgi:hypothetical protein
MGNFVNAYFALEGKSDVWLMYGLEGPSFSVSVIHGYP